MPRKLGHCAKEAASALGGLDLAQLLGDLTIRSHLLEGQEGNVTEAVVSSHEFSLIVGGSNRSVFVSRCRRRGVKGESPSAGCVLRRLNGVGKRR